MESFSNLVAWPTLLPNPVANRELKPLLDLIASQVERATACTTAVIFSIYNGEWQSLDTRGPIPSAKVEQFHHTLQQLLLDTPLQTQLPIFVNDVINQLPQANISPEMLDFVSSSAHSWMVIPLFFENRNVGLISLTHTHRNYFTPRHAKLVLLIFNQATQAQFRLASRAQTAAVLEERQRMARELHDSVTQVFYGIELAANTAHTLLKRGDTSRVSEQLSEVLNLAEAGLIEMRALLFELRPESLQAEGLVAALLKQTEALRVRHELKVEVELGSEPEVTLEVKEALYRIAQESFQNIIKHARANFVKVSLDWDVQGVNLKICDNGIGFDTNSVYPGHMGLVSMHERTRLLGGSFEISSESGHGTCTTAFLPVSKVALK